MRALLEKVLPFIENRSARLAARFFSTYLRKC